MPRFKVTFDDNTTYLVDCDGSEAEVRAHCQTPSAAKASGVVQAADGTWPLKKIKTVAKV